MRTPEKPWDMPDISFGLPNARGEAHSFDRSEIEKVLGLPFTPDNRVRILKSGKETFQTILDSIENAREIICVEIYIFKDDNTGTRIAELLKKKAVQGVRVYVIYDHFGSFLTSRHFWKDLAASGVKLRASHPFKWTSPRRYVRRNHRKLLTIDGQRAFTGGFNIADEYHRYFKRWLKAWRDTGILLEGPIAATLLEMFRQRWIAWKGKPITWDKKAAPVSPGVPVIPIFTNSAKERRRMRNLLYYSINRSREKIFITNAYFTPGLKLMKALGNAVKRGVDVKLLLPGKSDFAPVHYAGRHSYAKLMGKGIEIYNYQGSILHAKTAVFDRHWSVIGSANLDFQSLRRNDEGNVGILDSDFSRQMTRLFLDDLHQAVKLAADTWSERPFYEKVLEKFFALFRKRL
ncbi:MAG TPA: hypothetical protein ENH04_05585 [Nitrospirae bacterium]|nr:hypothetical protein [Nitrospirota bacterium]